MEEGCLLTWNAQPFNLTAAILFVATAGGLYAYFTYEKERVARQRIANQTKGVGKPKVGGPFDLVDHDGKQFTNEDLLGRYSLVGPDTIYETCCWCHATVHVYCCRIV